MRKSYYRSSAGYSLGLIFSILAIGLIGAIGWCMNIWHIIHMKNVLDSGEGIIRVVGIFVAPLGSIMGLFY